MNSETRAKIQEALSKILKAQDMLNSLCNGTVRWHMSVPARPDADPGLVIADGLDANRELIEALAAEPDEPTVSKSDRELVLSLVKKLDWNMSAEEVDECVPIIQQFLDAHLADHDKKNKPREYTDDELIAMAR